MIHADDSNLRAFISGDCACAYEFMGGHLTEKGAVFRVWAPNSEHVSLVGNFNQWNPDANPMTRLDCGIWELEVCGLSPGEIYKYAITSKDGRLLWKADPYAFASELRPGTASVLSSAAGYDWTDEKWIISRRKQPIYSKPLNTYEVHPGSWKRHPDGSFLSYRELAHELIPYVIEMGFTHIEIMPVTDYPFDASWGYQCTGYFSATPRYGSAHDLMYFIDCCHNSGIGVIMDWVPAHFPRDDFGLRLFDGTACYEYSHKFKGEHPSWGTMVFDYGKNEVISFLISSAMFWLREYHIDGLRVDAVASMLYLDYDRKDGEWIPNIYGGNENLEAIAFLRKLNSTAFGFDDSIMMIAEESTAWPLVTAPVDRGGLGFNFKWNMGWMNDSLTYMKMDPYFRSGNHSKLTFSLVYAFSENYILPLSHDEVVHMKGSLLGKMPGDENMKLAGVRIFWSYVLAHPGKKLLFMGAELGQAAEWNFESQLSWFELESPAKAKLHLFFKKLNRFYLEHSPLWSIDFNSEGFHWLCPDENEKNIIAFYRMNRSKHKIFYICNFSNAVVADFRIGLPLKGTYEVLISTDDSAFGGSGKLCTGYEFTAEKIECHNQNQSALISLPPLTSVFFRKKPNSKNVKKLRIKN